MRSFPWWLLGGAVLTFTAVVCLEVVNERLPLGAVVVVAGGWVNVIIDWIRDSRRAPTEPGAEDRESALEPAPRPQAKAGEFRVALVFVFFFGGLGLLLPSGVRLLFFAGDDADALLTLLGAGSLAIAALLVGVLVVLKRRRPTRAD